MSKTYNEEFKKQIVAEYLKGNSDPKLSAEYGVATHDETGYSVSGLCVFAGIPRSSYYKWLNRKESKNEQFNSQLLAVIKEAYEEKNGILGYRQMTIKLNRENDFRVNQKRVYRLIQILGLKLVCRRKRKNYIKSTPQVTAGNILNRKFRAETVGEKWLTDVTKMKYGVSNTSILTAGINTPQKCSGRNWRMPE